MADSMNDRIFEAFRRIAPGRTAPNRKDPAIHSEEYAQAVIGADAFGNPVPIAGADVGQLLRQAVELIQEQNLLLLTIAVQLGAAIPSADSLPETLSTPMVGPLAA